MPAATEQSEPDVTEIRELEERLDNFRIQVADDLTIRGNAWQGYALNVPICGGPPSGVIACCFEDGSCQLLSPEQCVSSGGTITGGSCDPNPCGGVTGGCCTDGVCSILSESDCTDGGGNYLGDDTTCDDVDCSVGACCFDSECEIFSEFDCNDIGGVYQGDGETCFPNPCPGACPCGFLNPDDGLYYLTKTYTNTAGAANCPEDGPCCISFDTGVSCCPPFTGARWYFSATCGVSYLTSESYDAGCNYSSEHENIDLQRYFAAHCLLEGGVATPDCSGVCDCLEPDCNVQACPPEDPCFPTGWVFCQGVTTTAEYSDPCILNPGSVFGDPFFANN